MTILDSFFFILKADSKDAVKGITKTGEAFEDLKADGKKSTESVRRDTDRMAKGLQAAGDVSQKAISAIGSELKGLALPAAAAVAALGSVTAALDHVNAMADTTFNAESLNIPVEQYDAFAKVLGSVGYEADETRDLFVDLAEAIGEGASDADSERAKTFKELGVSLKDAGGNVINATQGFEALSKAIDGMAPEKAIFMIRELGINDPKLLTLLTQGNAELEKRLGLVRQNGVLTAEQARAAKELRNEQQKLSLVLSGIGEAIARGVIPYVAGFFKALNAIVEYVQRHKMLFATFFGIPATVISVALIPAIIRATAATARMAVATLAATWPWLALAAAVAAVALAAEDLYLYFTDPTANTVTGELVKKFPALAKFIKDSADEVKGLIDFFKWLKGAGVETWDAIIDKLNSFNPQLGKMVGRVKDAMSQLFDWFKSLGLRIGDFFRDIFAGIINSLVDSIPESARKVLGIKRMATGAEARAERNGSSPQSPGGADMAVPGDAPSVRAANSVVGAASAAPVNAFAGANSNFASQSRTINAPVTIDKLEITTQATDPHAVAQAVHGGIQSQWQTSVARHDDGVSH